MNKTHSKIYRVTVRTTYDSQDGYEGVQTYFANLKLALHFAALQWPTLQPTAELDRKKIEKEARRAHRAGSLLLAILYANDDTHSGVLIVESIRVFK